MLFTVPPTVLQAGPGLSSCCPALGAACTWGTCPIAAAAAAADLWDCGFFESLAIAGAVAKAAIATTATATVRIVFVFAFFMEASLRQHGRRTCSEIPSAKHVPGRETILLMEFQ